MRIVARYRTAVVFVALLVVAELELNGVDPTTAHRWSAWASTDVANLQVHPLPALLLSAFVVMSYPWAWLLLAPMALLASDGTLRWRGSLLVIVIAHVGGTMFSEGIVWWRVHDGALPVSATVQNDVGPSYVVAAALTASLCWGWSPPAPLVLRIWRPCAGLFGLLIMKDSLFTGLTHLEVTPVGHTFAMATGALVGGLVVMRSGRVRKLQQQSGDFVRR